MYVTRWDIAATEGNLMVNANPTIARSIKTTLLTTCLEIIAPVCSTAIVLHANTAASTAPPRQI